MSNCPGCSERLRGAQSASPSKPPTATIWEYRINQHTGALSRVGTVATGTGANAIAITPNGRSLYVAVAAVWQYTINPTTGKSAKPEYSDLICACLWALADRDGPAATDIIASAASSSNPHVRASAISDLAAVGDDARGKPSWPA